MSAPDPTVKTPDATANSGCGAMPCSASSHPETDALEASIRHCMVDYTSRQYLFHARKMEGQRNGAMAELQARRNDCKCQSGTIIRLTKKLQVLEAHFNHIVAVANHEPYKIITTVNQIAGIISENDKSPATAL